MWRFIINLQKCFYAKNYSKKKILSTLLAKIPFHFFSIEIESPFLFFERMSKIGRNFLLLLLRFISNQKTFFVSRWKNQKFSISKLSWEFGFSLESSKVPRLGTLRYENESFQASFCWFRLSNIKWFIYQNGTIEVNAPHRNFL